MIRAVAIAVSLAAMAPLAHAGDAPPNQPAATQSPASPPPANAAPPASPPPVKAASPASSPPRRAVPDYDGRADEPTTAGDVLVWIPRAALFPVRIVVDYGVRRPFGWLVQKAEHSRGFKRLLRALFREIENANPLIFPVVFVDFGFFKSSVGARVLWRRGYLIPNSDVSLRVGTGGFDWWRADVGTKSKVGALRVTSLVGADDRPDYVFYGVGRDAPESARARYAARRLFARGAVGGHLRSVGDFLVNAAIEDTSLEPSTWSDDPSIEQQVAEGRIAVMPGGYEQDYRTARLGGRVTLDTRFDGRRARSGARVDAAVERVRDLTSETWWTRAELMVGGGLLLDPVAERKLDLRVGIELVEPDRDSTAIPFRELATMSGNTWLRGLPSGRVYGRSAAAVIADYHWPIAAWLDAHAHAGLGNVFDPWLSGFALRHLRGSFGGALTIAGLTERQVGVSFAFGTEPLGDGFEIDTVRFILEYTSDY